MIILKECLHEVVQHLQPFFTAMKDCMKSDKSLFVVLTRPKNPPLPLPDLAMEQWRKMAPSREEIIAAADAVSYYNWLGYNHLGKNFDQTCDRATDRMFFGPCAFYNALQKFFIHRMLTTCFIIKAGFINHFYAAAFPIKVTKPDWLSILKGRFITAVKAAEKCTDRQIKEFIDLKSSNFFEFEEKIFVIILQPKNE